MGEQLHGLIVRIKTIQVIHLFAVIDSRPTILFVTGTLVHSPQQGDRFAIFLYHRRNVVHAFFTGLIIDDEFLDFPVGIQRYIAVRALRDLFSLIRKGAVIEPTLEFKSVVINGRRFEREFFFYRISRRIGDIIQSTIQIVSNAVRNSGPIGIQGDCRIYQRLEIILVLASWFRIPAFKNISDGGRFIGSRRVFAFGNKLVGGRGSMTLHIKDYLILRR